MGDSQKLRSGYSDNFPFIRYILTLLVFLCMPVLVFILYIYVDSLLSAFSAFVCFHVQVACVEVTGRGRRLRRRVGLNHLQDVALCWWNLDEPGEELWPWTPSNTHRNNLVLLSCSPAEGLKVDTHTNLFSKTLKFQFKFVFWRVSYTKTLQRQVQQYTNKSDGERQQQKTAFQKTVISFPPRHYSLM